ncbi:MAG: DJ-1/PfpI family protein [Firmicutes bacterium]|nr:DJ-1/PfpI family protein [Bacillota bacterium]MBR6503535.1 DJ-1/PfpI family protein [Bacillota bacterium]
MDKKVYVHLAEGFEEIEAMATIDILIRGELDVEIVSVTGERIVKSVRGIGVQCDKLFEEVDYSEGGMIVLPGGIPGVDNLGAHEGLVKQLKAYMADDEKWVAAICAAPIILHDNGLIEGKTLTCFPGCGDGFTEANVVEDKVAVDGKLITSQGPGTAIEFGLKILELLQGKEMSDYVRGRLLA